MSILLDPKARSYRREHECEPESLPSVPPKPWISSRDRDNQCWASMIERGFGRWEEQSCSRGGLRLEKMLTDCHSGTRLAFYGAPAVVGVLLFANGIPRVQRDILQVREQPTAYSNDNADSLDRRSPSSVTSSARRSTPPTT